MQNDKVGQSRKQRLFFAIDVEPWIIQTRAIQKELQQQLHPLLHQVAWYPVHSFHITLAFLGSVTPKVKQDILQQVQELLLSHVIEPFELHALKLSLLSGRHIIIEVEGNLLEQLYEMLRTVNPGKEHADKERIFKPHIALGKLIKSRNINNARHILTASELQDLHPIIVKEFHLYESQPNRVYRKLESFSLEKKRTDKLTEKSEASELTNSTDISTKFNSSKNSGWEHFAHEADIGVRGRGNTIEDAFSMAALALTAVVTDPKIIIPDKVFEINCQAPDLEILFVDWLNAIIYEMDVQHVLFSEFDVKIKDLQLRAIIKGESLDRDKHHPAVDVKGATFSELKVIQQNGLWLAQCVVDV